MDLELASAQLVVDKKADLGEGAIWNHHTAELWWVDIEKGIFFTYDPETGAERSFAMGQRIGTVVPSKNGNAIVALEDGAYEYDLATGTKTLIASPEDPALGNRFNDGKCDPMGRLWAGTLNLEGKEGVAALYRIDSSGKATRMLNNVTCSNGICWSMDNTTMYYIDTPTGVVQAFDFDLSEGTISNGRIAIRIPSEMGLPDGMTIDTHGMLWIALWSGSCVTQWDPVSGRLLGRISIPAFNVTSCAFGGKDLDTLYITSASIDTPPGEKQKFPLAGGLFKAVPGSSGVNAFFFDK